MKRKTAEVEQRVEQAVPAAVAAEGAAAFAGPGSPVLELQANAGNAAVAAAIRSENARAARPILAAVLGENASIPPAPAHIASPGSPELDVPQEAAAPAEKADGPKPVAAPQPVGDAHNGSARPTIEVGLAEGSSPSGSPTAEPEIPRCERVDAGAGPGPATSAAPSADVPQT